MANHHLRNKTLSLKAKGLLSLMLSLPEDWDYTTRGLSCICKDGVDSIRVGIQELEANGYLVRERRRNVNGQYGAIEYTILEKPRQVAIPPPVQEKPILENPTQVIPMQVLPTQEIPAQLNIEELNTQKSNMDESNTHSFFPSDAQNEGQTEIRDVRERIKHQIEYDWLRGQFRQEQVDELLEIMLEVAMNRSETIRIGRDAEYPTQYVQERFQKITSAHIERVLEGIADNRTQVRNTKAYLLAALFNSVSTIDHYADAGMVNSGFSDCTMRLTYTAKVDSDNSLVVGDKGNDNKVVLTWKRTSETFYDTLVDDAHVYTYGIDLTKLFSDGKGDFSKVEFLVQNKTDNYYVQAKLNQDEGIYYVTGHTANKEDATHFVPVKTGDTKGRILIKGLEDDTYTMTEVRTDNGYVLLKQDIEVVISQKESSENCTIYASDALGLIQNDPRYAKVIQSDADLKNIPQKHLEHKLLTASATVSGKNVNMTEDNGSAYAEAPLTVVNTRGFDLPKTGDNGTMMFTIVGILLMVGATVVLYAVSNKKSA